MKILAVFAVLAMAFAVFAASDEVSDATDYTEVSVSESSDFGTPATDSHISLETGKTYKLTTDVTVDTGVMFNIANGVDCKIDVNGHTLSMSGTSYNMIVRGTLSLIDSSTGGNGKVEFTAGANYAIVNQGSLTVSTELTSTANYTEAGILANGSAENTSISGGSVQFTGITSKAAVNVQAGSLKMDEATIGSSTTSSSLYGLLIGGSVDTTLTDTSIYASGHSIVAQGSGSLTISGSDTSYNKYEAGNTVIYAQGSGVIAINSGTMSGVYAIWSTGSSEITINSESQMTGSVNGIQLGGSSSLSVTTAKVRGEYYGILTNSTRTTSITGGTFASGNSTDSSGYGGYTIAASKSTCGAITIDGGTFTSEGTGVFDVHSGVAININQSMDVSGHGDLVIKEGCIATIPEDKTFTVYGTLTNNGTITNDGTIINAGTFSTNAAMTGTGIIKLKAGTVAAIPALPSTMTIQTYVSDPDVPVLSMKLANTTGAITVSVGSNGEATISSSANPTITLADGMILGQSLKTTGYAILKLASAMIIDLGGKSIDVYGATTTGGDTSGSLWVTSAVTQSNKVVIKNGTVNHYASGNIQGNLVFSDGAVVNIMDTNENSGAISTVTHLGTMWMRSPGNIIFESTSKLNDREGGYLNINSSANAILSYTSGSVKFTFPEVTSGHFALQVDTIGAVTANTFATSVVGVYPINVIVTNGSTLTIDDKALVTIGEGTSLTTFADGKIVNSGTLNISANATFTVENNSAITIGKKAVTGNGDLLVYGILNAGVDKENNMLLTKAKVYKGATVNGGHYEGSAFITTPSSYPVKMIGASNEYVFSITGEGAYIETGVTDTTPKAAFYHIYGDATLNKDFEMKENDQIDVKSGDLTIAAALTVKKTEQVVAEIGNLIFNNAGSLKVGNATWIGTNGSFQLDANTMVIVFTNEYGGYTALIRGTSNATGNVNMTGDYQIKAKDEIIVEDDAALIIAGNLTVDGWLANEGTLSVTGTITNEGSITNSGTVDSPIEKLIKTESTGKVILEAGSSFKNGTSNYYFGPSDTTEGYHFLIDSGNVTMTKESNGWKAEVNGGLSVNNYNETFMTTNNIIDLTKGSVLTIPATKAFTGTVTGPDTIKDNVHYENKLVASELLAGTGGVKFTGGSIYIDGVLQTQTSGTITVTAATAVVSGTLDSAELTLQLPSTVVLQNFTQTTGIVEFGYTSGTETTYKKSTELSVSEQIDVLENAQGKNTLIGFNFSLSDGGNPLYYNGTAQECNLNINVTGITYAKIEREASDQIKAGAYEVIFKIYGKQTDTEPKETVETNWYIYPAPVTVTFDKPTKDYDGSTAMPGVFNPTVTGMKNDDKPSFNYDSKDAGDHKSIVIKALTEDGTTNVTDNYDFTVNGVHIAPVDSKITVSDYGIIEPKEVGLTWSTLTADELVYNKTAKTVKATATGVVSGDTVNVTAGLTDGKDNVNVGTFTYTATALSNSNYKLPANVVSEGYTITPKEVGLTWSTLTPEQLVYNKVTKTVTATATEVESGDIVNVAVGLNSAVDSNLNVGTFTYKATGLSNSNYKLPTDIVSSEYIITPKEVTLTWVAPADLVYNKTEKIPTVTAGGVEMGDIVTVTAGLTAGKDNVNVGTFTYTATGLSNANYSLPDAVVSEEYTITSKQLTGIAWTAPESLVYSKTAKVPTVAATGVIEGDTVNVTAALTEGKDNVNVTEGGFTFTASALDNANYSLPVELVSPVYVITAYEITELPSMQIKYDGTTKTVTFTKEYISGEALSITDTAYAATAGTYTYATVVENNHYTVSLESTESATASNYKLSDTTTGYGNLIISSAYKAYFYAWESVGTYSTDYEQMVSAEDNQFLIPEILTPVLNGYEFVGWTLGTDDSTVYRPGTYYTPELGNLLFYAYYEVVTDNYADHIVPARLYDHVELVTDGHEQIPESDLISNYYLSFNSGKYFQPASGDGFYYTEVVIHGTDLQKHYNGAGTFGYWNGVAFLFDQSGTGVYSKTGFDSMGGEFDFSAGTTVISPADAWYLNGAGGAFYIMYTLEDGTVEYFKIVSEVIIYEVMIDIDTARLHDNDSIEADDESSLIDNYYAIVNEYADYALVTVHGENLVKHANVNNTPGYWAGVAWMFSEVPSDLKVYYNITGFDGTWTEGPASFYTGGTTRDVPTFRIYLDVEEEQILYVKVTYDDETVYYKMVMDVSIAEDETTYTVTFNGNGQTIEVSDKEGLADGQAVSLPTVSLEGYTFNGWMLSPSGLLLGAQYVVYSLDANEDNKIILYASWTADTSAVDYTEFVVPASLHDNAGEYDDDDLISGYRLTFQDATAGSISYVKVTVHGKNLVKHTNSEDLKAYWAGIMFSGVDSVTVAASDDGFPEASTTAADPMSFYAGALSPGIMPWYVTAVVTDDIYAGTYYFLVEFDLTYVIDSDDPEVSTVVRMNVGQYTIGTSAEGVKATIVSDIYGKIAPSASAAFVVYSTVTVGETEEDEETVLLISSTKVEATPTAINDGYYVRVDLSEESAYAADTINTYWVEYDFETTEDTVTITHYAESDHKIWTKRLTSSS